MLKNKVIDAYNYSQEKHKGQVRKFTGEDYFQHPKAVARIVEELSKDEELIIVALLHDVIEDCFTNTRKGYHEIWDRFGGTVANRVLELTNTAEEREQFSSKAEYIANKMSIMDGQTLTVKLADRLHNIQYMDKDCKTNEQKQFVKSYWKQTTEILHLFNYNTKLWSQEVIQIHALLLSMITNQLEYISIKYNW